MVAGSSGSRPGRSLSGEAISRYHVVVWVSVMACSHARPHSCLIGREPLANRRWRLVAQDQIEEDIRLGRFEDQPTVLGRCEPLLDGVIHQGQQAIVEAAHV